MFQTNTSPYFSILYAIYSPNWKKNEQLERWRSRGNGTSIVKGPFVFSQIIINDVFHGKVGN